MVLARRTLMRMGLRVAMARLELGVVEVRSGVGSGAHCG
jgi:hypothetical protein